MSRTKGMHWLNVIVPCIAIVFGVVTSFVIIALTGISPLATFRELFRGAFGMEGKVWPLLLTLGQSTPLILTGLSAMCAFRVGVFCIAQESQYVFGAIMAAWLGSALSLPSWLLLPFILFSSMLAGAIAAEIPAMLKVRLGVNEIISSIMVNSISTLVLEYLVAFPLRADAGQKAQSAVLPQNLWLFQFVKGSRWGVSFVIAVCLAAFLYFLLWKTSFGYEVRMVGQSPLFSEYGGVSAGKITVMMMGISGALAGLAGSMEVLGNYHRIMTGFSSGLGFDGLSVAMLGESHPLGVFIVAILLAGIRQGAQLGLQINLHIPRELGGVLIALIILFVALENIYKPHVEKWIKKWGNEKEKAAGI